MDARAATKTLVGQWHGKYGMAKCPAHNDKTPSLQLSDGNNGQEMMVHCHGGCGWQDVKAALRSQGVLPEWAPNNTASPNLLMNGKPMAIGGNESAGAAVTATAPEPENNNRQHALEIWNAASKAGPIAATYLRSRGISITAPASIREVAALKHGPTGLTFPALIAAIQGPDDKAIIAIQRTFLSADFTAKAKVSRPKMALGSIKGGKVRLAKAAPTLAICEGVETGLSIQERYGFATWCALGASNLPNIALPPVAEVGRVILCADNGEAGIREAEKAAARFDAEGRQVFVARPPAGMGDFNDLICQ